MAVTTTFATIMSTLNILLIRIIPFTSLTIKELERLKRKENAQKKILERQMDGVKGHIFVLCPFTVVRKSIQNDMQIMILNNFVRLQNKPPTQNTLFWRLLLPISHDLIVTPK
jgi:hypothetical protein